MMNQMKIADLITSEILHFFIMFINGWVPYIVKQNEGCYFMKMVENKMNNEKKNSGF